MDEGAVFTATALASALGCILMGVLAKYPIATAPALGINAFFSYSVCIGMGVPWQTALAGVFVASLIFIVITIFKLRELIIDAIPADLKYAISGGIGLFIAFLGLSEGGIIVSDDSTLVALGSLSVGTTWLTIFGLVITAVLMVRRVPGGIFIGMAATTVLGLLTGLIQAPSSIVSAAPSISSTFLVALNHVGDINSLQMWVVVLTFLLVTFFDTAGTLVGLANQAGFMKDNKMPRVGKALASDSTAMLAGSLLGTSPVGAYVESSAGIAVGGRSGLTAVTTGIFFLFGLFTIAIRCYFPSDGTSTDRRWRADGTIAARNQMARNGNRNPSLLDSTRHAVDLQHLRWDRLRLHLLPNHHVSSQTRQRSLTNHVRLVLCLSWVYVDFECVIETFCD